VAAGLGLSKQPSLFRVLETKMLRRTLIAFTTVVALGCVPLTSSAFAAGHAGGHSGGGHAAGRAGGGHAMAGRAAGGRAMGGHARSGGAHYAGGRRGYGGGYGGGYGYGGGDYGCNGYYDDYNGCGYNPGAAIVGGLIGGALNGFGAY
jgi:hypothetical protein